jgi:hypothetical protein
VTAFGPARGLVLRSSTLTFAVNDLEHDASVAGRQVQVQLRGFHVLDMPPAKDSQLLQVVVDPGVRHQQVNMGSEFESPQPVAGRGFLRFRMWNPGVRLKGFTVALVAEPSLQFLQYVAPPMQWRGFRDFALPLSAFGEKDRWEENTFNRAEFIFNFDRPRGVSDPTLYTFAVRGVRLVTVQDEPRPTPLSGRWRNPTEFEVTVPGPGGLLWKENFIPSWDVTGDGRPLDVYEAGPGMIWIQVPGGVRSVTFRIPFPGVFVLGLVVSFLLSVLLLTGWMYGRRRQTVTTAAPRGG